MVPGDGMGLSEPVAAEVHRDTVHCRWTVGTIHCRGPASAGSRGYPQDERRWQERERRHVRPALIGPSLRVRKRERKSDQTGGAAESGRVWQSLSVLYFLP